MSSIGEAKEKLASASASADEAKTAVASAKDSIDEALEALNDAASDSGHEKMMEALSAYQEATKNLEEALLLIGTAQEAADEYVSQLG
jgi:hypothetical protein